MRAALHAEWTKLRTVAGTGWLLLGSFALTVALSAVVDAALTRPDDGSLLDTAKLSLAGILLGQAIVAVIAVTVIGGVRHRHDRHHAHRDAASDDRPRGQVRTLLAGVVLVVGTSAVLGCLLAGRLLLPGNGFSSAHGYPPCPSPTARRCAPPAVPSSTSC